jgi:hypothetical protein
MGRACPENNPKYGRANPSTDDDHVQKVRVVIPESRRLRVRENSEDVRMSESSCHRILGGKLETRRVAARVNIGEARDDCRRPPPPAYWTLSILRFVIIVIIIIIIIIIITFMTASVA